MRFTLTENGSAISLTLPNDISELMIDAAAALENGDAIALRQLMAHCQDWMQTEKEASAQAAMLQAMMDAVDQ